MNPLNIGENVFYEKINIVKLQHIIDNPNKYEQEIKEQERVMRRSDNNYNAFRVFDKIVKNCVKPPELEGTEYALIKVQYKKGKNSNGIGRWYAIDGIGLQPLCTCVRHTICNGIWVDIDQVNSHPNIFTILMKKYGFKSPLLDECINDRDGFLKKICENRADAKTKVIAVINGASYDRHKILNQLGKEIKPCIDYINNLPEYKDIAEYVKKSYPDDNNIAGKIISRILQVIENNLLELYVKFFYEKGLIPNNMISLIFDGLQLLSNDKINQELLDECTNYAFEETGYYIPLKIKPFDEFLLLPEDYSLDEDDYKLISNKYKIGLREFVENNEKLFKSCEESDGSHKKVADILHTLFKDMLVFDPNIKTWYYCNIKNIWKETHKPFILKYLFVILEEVFKIRKMNIEMLIYEIDKKEEKTMDDTIKKNILQKDAIKNYTFSLKVQNSGFQNSILSFEELFIKEKFNEKKIDSKAYLFAFKNKVFDFKTNQLREIQPDDYIMTNTLYNYPEYVDEKDKEFIINYFNTLFPDEEVKNYILDSFSSTLNGDKSEQYFNILNGSGCNSKTTLMNLYTSALGDYAVNVSAETFTKPKKSSNDTGELYKCKGKRAVFANEPESNDDNKLQTAILKRVADEGNQTLIARALYCNPIEFKIQFQLNIICNNKPELSSVDGGIARRLRIVDFLVKFIDEPNENNKYQAKLDPSIMSYMKSDGVRNAFITLLIERWINRVGKFSKIPVPSPIVEASKEYIDDSNPVLGFIQEYYIITNDENDRIKSSDLFIAFSNLTRNKTINSKRFKDDMLGISGISTKKNNVMYFTGLKAIEINDEEN